MFFDNKSIANFEITEKLKPSTNELTNPSMICLPFMHINDKTDEHEDRIDGL